MRLLVLLVIGSRLVVGAEDARLARIRALLGPMRADPLKAPGPRGASEVLTTVKHELRDWIESRIPALKWDGRRWNPDPIVLQEQLNAELGRAGLACDLPSTAPCPDWSQLGFLAPIVFDLQRNFLVVKTGVGIECGPDESAYAYESADNKWIRRWQSEQNDYRKGKYLPQAFREVLLSPGAFGRGADEREHLILTLGTEPWCASNLHDVYYRVWQTKSAYPEPKLLLDGKEWAFVEGEIRGSAGQADVMFEYTSAEGTSQRRQTFHYSMDQGKLKRVDPVALGPRDFTAFWLSHPWPEISDWTAWESRPALEEWLQKHKEPLADFGYPTFHCSEQKDLWQVRAYSGEGPKEPVYFLVRWRPPYRFTMVSARDRPWADCMELDREADEQRSLFPVR